MGTPRRQDAKKNAENTNETNLSVSSLASWRFGVPFVFLSAMILFSCSRPPPAASQSLKIVVSCDTDGWIVPCGCTANQSGGLPRRATFLDGLRRKDQVIYADAGGASAGNSAYDRAKFEAILAGEKLMGITAHNLGRSELAFGPIALRDIAARTNAPFVSANAKATDGSLLAEPMRILTLAGRRIALVGVVSPSFASKGVVIDEPLHAISDAISARRGQFDSLIVLAYLPLDELNKLASDLPEADAIIGGPTFQSVIPHPAGHVLLGAATNKGKFVVSLHPPESAGGMWSGEVDELGPAFSDEIAQVQNIHDYLATLGRLDLSAADSGLAPAVPPDAPANYRIAGSASCASCHAAENTAWQNSKHAHAWQTLVEKQFHVDSYCQQCHTTGYGLSGGFQSRAASMQRVDVGCENCHGPSLAHVNDPALRTPFNAFDQCLRCHDHENSPKFDATTFWAAIQHGKGAKP